MNVAGPEPVPLMRTRMGVDVVEVERMRALLARRPAATDRIFTEVEREWCEARPRPWEHYAARFAAKEAVRKALGRACPWTAVEVQRLVGGAPRLALAPVVTADGADVVAASLSLAHDGGVAVAVVMLEVRQVPAEASPPASESR